MDLFRLMSDRTSPALKLGSGPRRGPCNARSGTLILSRIKENVHLQSGRYREDPQKPLRPFTLPRDGPDHEALLPQFGSEPAPDTLVQMIVSPPPPHRSSTVHTVGSTSSALVEETKEGPGSGFFSAAQNLTRPERSLSDVSLKSSQQNRNSQVLSSSFSVLFLRGGGGAHHAAAVVAVTPGQQAQLLQGLLVLRQLRPLGQEAGGGSADVEGAGGSVQL